MQACYNSCRSQLQLGGILYDFGLSGTCTNLCNQAPAIRAPAPGQVKAICQ